MYESQGTPWSGSKASLKDQTQGVIVDGETSKTSAVFRCFQGTVLGPIPFLVFISDLPEYVQPSTKIFVDDLIIYHKIHTHNESKIENLTNNLET